MTILSKLNLSDKTKVAMLTSPENRMRAKMLDAIETQIATATADAVRHSRAPSSRLVTRQVSRPESGRGERVAKPRDDATSHSQ